MALTTTPSNELSFELLGQIQLNNAGDSTGAEIVSFDPETSRAFVTSITGLRIVDLSDPTTPTVIDTIDFTAAPFNFATSDVNSVSVKNGLVAVAVANDPKYDAGKVFLLDTDGNLLNSIDVGALPDMLTFTPDGTKILVANEGELDADGTDAEGSVSIIDVSQGAANATVTTAGFSGFDAQELRDAGVRLFIGTPGFEDTTVSQDLEPEYISVSPDGTTAFVTLQENNAIGILDIATGTFTDVVPLGLKSWDGIPVDMSDRDGAGNSQAIDLRDDLPVFGLYMPDAISSFTSGGQTFYVTANEGDDRSDFIDTEVDRANGIDLDDATFPNETDLLSNNGFGRVDVVIQPGINGDTDTDGDIDTVLTYGGRSFSILDSSGNIVFDSAGQIEQFIATTGLVANGGAWDDSRSDAKGPEPEAVTVSEINGQVYAFVGLERAQGVMVYNVTDPADVTFTGFVRNSVDLRPEGITIVEAADSPTGKGLMLVANEGSNTLSTYEITPAAAAPAYTLQLLHFSDAEAGLLAGTTAKNLAALVDVFEDEYANSLTLSSGDLFIPGPFLAGGTDPSLSGLVPGNSNPGRFDISIMNAIGVQASAIGNHEFDLGSNVFASAIASGSGYAGALFPYLSANLNFSGDSALNPRFTNTVGTGLEEASSLAGRIAPSAVITEGGEKIGLVGATTQILEQISSPSGTEVVGFPTGPGANGEVNDMALLAAQLQPVIDDLIAQGVNKIVLVSHLQQLSLEQELATLLEGVDIIIAGGSHTRLGDSDDVAAEFPGHEDVFEGTYPIVTEGADGKTTLIVNTDGEYTYLGRLVVDFDANGDIILDSVTDNTAVNGGYASTDQNVADAWETTVDNLDETAFAEGTRGNQVGDLTDAVQQVIDVKSGNIYGYTDVYLEGERSQVRSQETNLGNLSADANALAAREAAGVTGARSVMVSIKNGGGIRAQIGTLGTPDANGNVPKIPPAGGTVSQLDTENALRFNNGLMVFDTTAQGLLNILNSPNALAAGNGGFIQIGGVKFSYDPTRAAGDRVRDIALINEAGQVVSVIVDDGVVLAGAPSKISVVILNFTAQGGDGYIIKPNGENFRYLLNDGTLSGPIDEALDFTASGVVPTNIMGEIQALSEYMQTKHGTAGTAYDVADTAATEDERIQNVVVRTDGVQDAAKIVYGTSTSDNLIGGSGNDTFQGLAGADIMTGRAGDDLYKVDNAGDIVVELSGDGNDTIHATVSYTLSDNVENLRLNGSALNGTGNALNNGIYGNGFANTLEGGAGDDILTGFGGADVLNGGDGHDQLRGGDGVDTLSGGIGDDRIEGGRGRDVLAGSAGADRFVFNEGDFGGATIGQADRITDFSQADGDRIELKRVDAIAGGADNAFTFIGTGNFSGAAGELRYRTLSDGNTYIYGDTNGDRNQDFVIRLDGAVALTGADFLL